MDQGSFDEVKREILDAWGRAETRDEGFRVIVEYGRKHGFKNVIAAIEGRVPKRFTREKSVSEWIEEQHGQEQTAR